MKAAHKSDFVVGRTQRVLVEEFIFFMVVVI